MALEPGARLGPYQATAKIGEGGMGEIWRARDTRLGRQVAIKLLPDRLLDRSLSQARFEQEARAASSLNHPNIVTVHDVGRSEAGPYLVMELVEGRTLRQMLSRSRPMKPRRLLGLAAQIADALAAAHAAGIVHRDLKPENVIVTAEGRVKILDFGLAKLAAPSRGLELAAAADDSTIDPGALPGPAGAPISEAGTLLGTIGFMAPEQVRGEAVDFRADQFAFGAMLYETATGRPAFARSSRLATLAAILDEEPEPIAEVAPDTPAPLRWIIERCLAKRPQDRYASTLDLARELSNLGEHLEEASGSGDSGSRLAASRARSRSARRIAAWAAVAALLGLIAALAWLRFAGPRPLPTEKQLAVLAFRTTGADPVDRAFSDGLFETLTTRLTQIERFQGSFWVMPASEVRRGGVESVEAARDALGATLVITGSLQRLGDGLRVTANLVDATSLRQLRALSFDTHRGDAAALQDDLVRRVGEMLDLEVGTEAVKVLDAGRTDVAEAYDAYLRGRGHLLDFQSLDSVEAAVADLQEAIQRDPGFALAYAGLGEAHWRRYELTHDPALVALARRACERALALNDLLAPVHVTLGLIDRGTGEVERAAEDFRTALRLDPASAVARRELGTTLARLGRNAEAERTLIEAIERRPGDWANHNALGVFYYRDGRYPEATEQFRRIVEIAPGNVRGYSNLGGIYQLQGLYEQARDVLDRAVAIHPSSSALSNLGTAEFFLGDYEEAAHAFERALELGGERDYRIWHNLAAAYSRAPGERSRAPAAYRKAVELVEQALEVNPTDPWLLADLAECLAMLDRAAEARERIGSALEIEPDDPDVLYRATSVYEHLGDRELALERIGDALRAGYSRREIAGNPDFAALRSDPRFEALWSATAPEPKP